MPTSLIVTSINAPTRAVKSLAEGCLENSWDFLLAGDSKGPTDFTLEGCRFLSIETQRKSGFALADVCREKSYTRKNLAYLEAMRGGADVIVETDDDNHPLEAFWEARNQNAQAREVRHDGWVNAYSYFTGDFIYPRGMPLSHARDTAPAAGPVVPVSSPIHQGLADQDPDVDAVYRMLFPLPFSFAAERGSVFLEPGAWCPFNSQNTTFFKSAFPLLYLPAHCSFRMTDIWRSFVAQRILHAKNQGVLFHSHTVWQERNDHDLNTDFRDELPGYNHNREIREELLSIPFTSDQSTTVMLETCYGRMIARGWVGKEEEGILAAWLTDLADLGIR